MENLKIDNLHRQGTFLAKWLYE